MLIAIFYVLLNANLIKCLSRPEGRTRAVLGHQDPGRLALLLWVAKPQRTNLKCFPQIPAGLNPKTKVIFEISIKFCIGGGQTLIFYA